jgi:hypothetical protein
MVAAVRYRGSLIALFNMWTAIFQQYCSCWSGVNSPNTRTASPTVATTLSLHTNSNANGAVLIKPAPFPVRQSAIRVAVSEFSSTTLNFGAESAKTHKLSE